MLKFATPTKRTSWNWAAFVALVVYLQKNVRIWRSFTWQRFYTIAFGNCRERSHAVWIHCIWVYTGTNFNRPGFQEALALIQHRRVGRFIVKDLSRLGRNTVEVGQYIGVVFPRFGVEFISVHDGPESGDLTA